MGNKLTNNQLLFKLMEQHHLSAGDVAVKTGFSKFTVYSWRVDPESAKYRAMPDRALRLLKFELNEGKNT